MITKLKKRDGRIVDFNQDKITQAILKAAKSVGEDNLELAKKLSEQVIKYLDLLDQETPGVEAVQDLVEKVLIENGLVNIAKHYILYRQKRTELREAKSMMGITDDCKLSINALTVLEGRYLRKNQNGEISESPRQLFERVAQNIAEADARYKQNVERSKEEFLNLMLSRDFMPNSPTLMNAGTEIQQLSACFVLPVEDSMDGIFDSVKHAAIIHKCLAGDTHIFTNPSIKELSKISAGDKVATDQKYEKVASSHTLGKKKAIKVVTNYGYEIVGSREHKLRSIDENGNYIWKEIGDLKKGDWLAIQKLNRDLGNDELPQFNFEPKEYNQTSFKARIHSLPVVLTPELAYLFGAFIGDGSFNKNDSGRIRITIGKGKEDLAQKLSHSTIKLFGIKPKLKAYGNVYDWSIQSVQIREWFRFLEINKNSARSVRIPSFLFKASNKCISAFLRGYFDTDGCINNRGYISLTTSSELMTKDLQNIFLLFGIPTIKRRLQKVNSWQITVTTNAGMKNFQKHIGFSVREKERRLAALDMDKIFLRKEYLPNQQKNLSYYLKNKLRRKYGRIVNGERQLNIQQAKLLLGQMSLPEIKEMLSRNQFYVQVKELSSLGEIEMYDLTIPSGHCYLANGFVSHNSGGGTGFSFSRLRQKGAPVGSTGGIASGPISFMKVFDAATNVIKQGGKRRGANMGVLRVDHPDILDFITCKERNDQITNFNISVAITEKFMESVTKNENYDLVSPHNKKVVGQLNAKRVFDLICTMAWKNGEPGIIFIDRMNSDNPTPKLGNIESTNPCGEVPLLPYESCNLGSINLANHITENHQVDWEKLRKTVYGSVHFLDNVIDMNKFPLPKITEMVLGNRKIGLGVMGWADMLIKLRIPYNSEEAINLGEKVMCFIHCEGRKASQELAKVRGLFPNFKESVYDNDKEECQIRNATITTIAPTGSISIIAGASSGIEPLFAISYVRKTPQFELLEVNPLFEELMRKENLYNPELMRKIAKRGSIQGMEEIPEYVRKIFITAMDLTPESHVRMQAAFQRHTDNAVSKTVNFPFQATVEEIMEVFLMAHRLGCKGITIYRDGSREVQVLNVFRREDKETPTPVPEPKEETMTVGAEFDGGCKKCNL